MPDYEVAPVIDITGTTIAKISVSYDGEEIFYTDVVVYTKENRYKGRYYWCNWIMDPNRKWHKVPKQVRHATAHIAEQIHAKHYKEQNPDE